MSSGQIVGLVAYGIPLLVSTINRTLMPGLPSASHAPASAPTFLIPARNEASVIGPLVSSLIHQGARVWVYNDGSTDDTAARAEAAGATVSTATEELPPGWTGKNFACASLANRFLSEHPDEPWFTLIDADVLVSEGFVNRWAQLLASQPDRVGAVTGFPRVVPGRGAEPLWMLWVGWSLLALNPFGLTERTGLSHSRFLNGQLTAWRARVYHRLQPNEAVRTQIMEDVGMGRYLARHRVAVSVVNASDRFAVRMYDHWRQTLDGFSKNSYEITGSVPGSLAFSLFLLFVAWGWLLMPVPWVGLTMLTLSGLLVASIARAPLWPALFMPIGLSIGALTVLRSTVWHRTGRVQWKGRVYRPGP